MYNRMAWPQGNMMQNPVSAMPTQFPAQMQMPMNANPTVPGTVVVPNGGTMMPVNPPAIPSGVPIGPMGTTFVPFTPPREESYVENILRMNLGKVATIYMTYENNSEWNAKIFKGVLEAAGRDHIVIRDPANPNGKRYLLLTLNLDYITFDEPLVYNLPFGTPDNSVTRRR